MARNNQQCFDEILQCRTADFVLHVGLANDQLFVGLEAVQDHLRDFWSIVVLEEAH